MEISKLSINKKITAFFVDGSQKMNLGVAAVVDLLKGAERVQVQIAPVKRAERLLTDLAETSGRIVEKADEGVFLAQPMRRLSRKLSLSRWSRKLLRLNQQLWLGRNRRSR
jgi:hypothetical protein